MKHISEIIEDILVEWAYRVHDGMPNPKNAQHIHELRKSMEELNLPNKVIYEVIQNLINEEKVYYSRSKKSKRIVQYKNKDNFEKGIEDGSHEKVDQEKAAKEYEQEGGETETDTTPGMKISKDSNLTKKGDDKKAPADKKAADKK